MTMGNSAKCTVLQKIKIKNAVKWTFQLVCACSFCGYQSSDFFFLLQVLEVSQQLNAKSDIKTLQQYIKKLSPHKKKKAITHPDEDKESHNKVYLSGSTVLNRAARSERV